MARLARGAEPPLPRRPLPLRPRRQRGTSSTSATERLRTLCSSLLLHAVPCSFRPFEGWLTTLPLGLDQLRLRRAFDTEALAASFPFAAADPPIDPDGVLYGLTPAGAPDHPRPLPRKTTTTPSCSPAAAPARATSQSSKRSGCSTAACRCS